MTDNTEEQPPFDMDEPTEKLPEEQSAPGTDIVTLVEHSPEIVLLDEKKRGQLFAHIEDELIKFEPDLTNTAGREEIRRFAAKITRTKTAADKAGLKLTEDARAMVAKVNEARKEVRERLDTYSDRARQPLTEWENAENTRVAECEAALQELTAAGVVPLDATAESVRKALAWAEGYELDPARFQSLLEPALKARNHTIELLTAGLERLQQQEKERAELEALRAEMEERRRADEKREAQERDKREFEEAQARLAAEEAERAEREKRDAAAAAAEAERAAAEAKEREETAAREAEERAKAAAAEAAEREKREAEEAHQRELAAERERAEAAERAAREAEEQRKREDEARLAEAAAAQARIAKLEADKEHRRICKTEAKEAMMVKGITDEQASAIVLMIVAGEIPRVSLDFAAEPKVKAPEVA